MEFDFELFLTLAVIATGFISLFQLKKTPPHKIVAFARSYFPVLLIVLVFRSFLVEPFRIPSGSLEPTLLPGDFIAVNKFVYGLRLPVTMTKVVSIGEPQVGDIVVFHKPQSSLVLIKRVVGVPGDIVNYTNKTLYINGIKQPQKKIGPAIDEEGTPIPVEKYEETLNGVHHDIYENPAMPADNFTITVPKGDYFMMGDNRDNSDDSRYWGFLPEKDIMGKAFLIWFSWDGQQDTVRWHRIGTLIHGR